MNRFNLLAITSFSSLLLLPAADAGIFNKSHYPTPVLVSSTATTAEIRQLAQAITVKVLSVHQGGSGILINKVGQTYTILTDAHVVNSKETYRIQTNDGKTHSAVVINRGDSLKGNDLALLQFQAQENYRVVPLAPTANLSENQEVFAAGFPSDTKELVISSGKISLLSSQPLVGGYQIGYTNEIQQGMSGGPLLNLEGKLIGVNGLLNNAILNDAYVYQNGSRPSTQQLQRLKQFSFAVPIQTLAQVAPNIAGILTKGQNQQQTSQQPVANNKVDQVNNIAQKITVRIDSKNNGNGSGVIIAHTGQTYYVVTALHVVKKPDSYEIVTPDGQRYAFQVVEKRDSYEIVTPDGQRYTLKQKNITNPEAKGLDAALLKFTSNRTYSVATISQNNPSVFDNTNTKTQLVFISGFPKEDGGKRKLTPGYLSTREDLFARTESLVGLNSLLEDGYELSYSNLSLEGMSGGPVLDVMGQVIGIDTAIEQSIIVNKDAKIKNVNIGFSSGLPSSNILTLATQAGINIVVSTKRPSIKESEISSLLNHSLFAIQKPLANANDNDLFQFANKLWRVHRYSEAEAVLQPIIQRHQNFYQAYYALGLVLSNEEDKLKESLDAFDKAIAIRKDYCDAWKYKSSVLVKFKKYTLSLDAINKAIDCSNRNDFSLYVIKSGILMNLKHYPEALTAINEAINIKELDFNYLVRAVLRYELKDYQAALLDLNRVIALQPNDAKNYILRGNILSQLKEYKAAIVDVNQAIKLQPGDAKIYVFRGNYLYLLKEYQAALADANQAIKLQPDNANAYMLRGHVHNELKEYQAALADANQAIKLQPDHSQNYAFRASVRYFLRDYQAALADANQAIKLQPDNGNAYFWRGNVHTNLKEYQAALTDFNQAVTLQPNDAINYDHRGDVLYQLKDYQAALANANQAIKLQPDNAKHYVLRGVVLYQLKESQAALTDFNRAVKLQPNDGNAYYWRGSVFLEQIKDYQAALADSNQALHNLPSDDVRPLILRGIVRKQLKEYQAALADFNQVIKLQPNEANYYILRGIVLSQLKDYQAALADANQAIKLQPDNANNYILRGIVLSQLKDYQAALADYNQALKLQADNANNYILRGKVRVELKDYQAALADYNQAIKLKPNNGDAYYLRGVVRYLLRDYQPALADLSQAIKVQPDNSNAYYVRGKVRVELRDYQAALADCNQVLKLQPNDVMGYYCRGVLYQKQGDDNTALSEYAQALAKDAKWAAAMMKIGYIKYERGDVEGAIQQWQKAVKIDDESIGAQLALAVVLYSRGEEQKALNMAQAALRVDKTWADVAVLKQNLWGTRLVADAQKLLSHPRVQAVR